MYTTFAALMRDYQTAVSEKRAEIEAARVASDASFIETVTLSEWRKSERRKLAEHVEFLVGEYQVLLSIATLMERWKHDPLSFLLAATLRAGIAYRTDYMESYTLWRLAARDARYVVQPDWNGDDWI